MWRDALYRVQNVNWTKIKRDRLTRNNEKIINENHNEFSHKPIRWSFIFMLNKQAHDRYPRYQSQSATETRVGKGAVPSKSIWNALLGIISQKIPIELFIQFFYKEDFKRYCWFNTLSCVIYAAGVLPYAECLTLFSLNRATLPKCL